MEISSRDDIVQKIVVRKDLNMRKGKIAAQVAHASNESIIDLYLKCDKYRLLQSNIHTKDDKFYYNLAAEFREKQDLMFNWWNSGHTKIVLGCDSEDQLNQLIKIAVEKEIPNYPVTDFGLTEFHGVKTLTCCAFGPWFKNQLDEFTSNLPLI